MLPHLASVLAHIFFAELSRGCCDAHAGAPLWLDSSNISNTSLPMCWSLHISWQCWGLQIAEPLGPALCIWAALGTGLRVSLLQDMLVVIELSLRSLHMCSFGSLLPGKKRGESRRGTSISDKLPQSGEHLDLLRENMET